MLAAPQRKIRTRRVAGLCRNRWNVLCQRPGPPTTLGQNGQVHCQHIPVHHPNRFLLYLLCIHRFKHTASACFPFEHREVHARGFLFTHHPHSHALTTHHPPTHTCDLSVHAFVSNLFEYCIGAKHLRPPVQHSHAYAVDSVANLVAMSDHQSEGARFLFGTGKCLHGHWHRCRLLLCLARRAGRQRTTNAGRMEKFTTLFWNGHFCFWRNCLGKYITGPGKPRFIVKFRAGFTAKKCNASDAKFWSTHGRTEHWHVRGDGHFCVVRLCWVPQVGRRDGRQFDLELARGWCVRFVCFMPGFSNWGNNMLFFFLDWQLSWNWPFRLEWLWRFRCNSMFPFKLCCHRYGLDSQR